VVSEQQLCTFCTNDPQDMPLYAKRNTEDTEGTSACHRRYGIRLDVY
jgi:hypothetical protein